MVLGCSSCPYPLLFFIEWLGKGTFGTCQVMWYTGMNVAVKSPHHRIIQEKNVLMEAKMLQVSITTISYSYQENDPHDLVHLVHALLTHLCSVALDIPIHHISLVLFTAWCQMYYLPWSCL